MPDLDQDQVAEPIGGLQEREVVSIGNQEHEVLPIPVEEMPHLLVMDRSNEKPDGADEPGMSKPVQATDD